MIGPYMMTSQFKNNNTQCSSYLRVISRACMNQNSLRGGKRHIVKRRFLPVRPASFDGVWRTPGLFLLSFHQFYYHWHSEHSTPHLDHNLLAFGIILSDWSQQVMRTCTGPGLLFLPAYSLHIYKHFFFQYVHQKPVRHLCSTLGI